MCAAVFRRLLGVIGLATAPRPLEMALAASQVASCIGSLRFLRLAERGRGRVLPKGVLDVAHDKTLPREQQ